MKVLFLTNVPSPYRVDFFNELGKYTDLTVLFEKKTSDERDSSWKNYSFINFNGVFLKGKSIVADAAFCPSVIKYVKDQTFDRIICANFTSLTGMLAIRYMKKHNIPYFLECDGGFAKDGRGFKEKLKKRFITGAQGYFSTGAECDNYYVAYGAKADKIIRYPFTSLKESDIQGQTASIDEKQKLRSKLGIFEHKVILTVGQFIYRKGFDILLEAMKNMPKDIGVYFVGGIPTDEYIQLQDKHGLKNAHFVGFKSKKELSEYYKAADVFVLPTREDIWGLVIQEAMAEGLPVITTDRCAAGTELIQNGKNGYIVPCNDENILAINIMDILNDPQRITEFGENSLRIVRDYTIEKMVKTHIDELKE